MRKIKAKKVRIKVNNNKATVAEPRWWSILKTQAAEFCHETGLHGYKYISQTQRSKAERIIWAISVFASLCSALVLMKMAWNYYATHPTLTVIESTHYGIWNYPFPAITVCNINRMSYNLTKQFVENLETSANVSKEFLMQEMRLLNELIMPGVFGHDVHKNLTRLQDILDHNNLSILDVLNLITKNCSSLLVACKWKGIIDQCDRYFKQSLSRDGLCCSFNYYALLDETISFQNVERTAACGFETGMTILVNPEPNDYHASIIGSYGVKIMVHYSLDYPDYNSEIQLVRLNSQHFMSMNPYQMYSKPEVRNLAISTRDCIFSDEADKTTYANIRERNLTVGTYTYHNCLTECRATVARMKCGCIPYYFPQNTFYDTSWPGANLSYRNIPEKIDEIQETPCGCMKDCALYRYPIESSFAFLDPTLYYSEGSFSMNSSNAMSIGNHSLIHVYFNDLVGFQYRRSVNYSWRNLFATFGGLLGLFAGFSLMSIFEFLYFFVIRVITDACINSKKHESNMIK